MKKFIKVLMVFIVILAGCVNEKKPESSEITLPSMIKLGESINLGNKFKWSTEDKNVVDIDETGKLTGKGLGITNIIVENNKEFIPKQITVMGQYEKFYEDIETMPIEKRQLYLNTIFETIKERVTFPITENNRATFVVKGNYQKMILYGDMTPSWSNRETGVIMKKIEGTDLFYATRTLPTDSYMEYKFYDGSKSYIDELNKRSVESSSGGNSIFWMPGYAPHPEILKNNDIPHGAFTSFEDNCFYYTSTGAKENGIRKYYVYTPAGYDKSNTYRVIYFHDGYNFATRGFGINILDYMIAKGEIEPVIGVFIDPIDRNADYVLKNKDFFADYIANNVVNKIDSNYSTIKSQDGRVVIGASNGGLISAYIGYRHKDKFKYILAFSGAFDVAFSPYFGDDFGNKVDYFDWPVKIMMICGNYDELISTNDRFYTQLKKNNSLIGVDYKKYNSGHKYSFWGSTLREGLLYLIGK